MSLYTALTVFARNELTTAAKWFSRVWSPFNTAMQGIWGPSNTWTALTMQNSWAAATSTSLYGAPQWRVRDGILQLRGAMKGGSLSGTVPAFTLPVGARPNAYCIYTLSSAAGSAARLNIDASGAATVEQLASGALISLIILSGITIPVD